MLGIVLTFMLVSSVIFGVINGTQGDIVMAVTEGTSQAMTLCITMAGMMALWSGVMKIAEEAGLVDILSRLLRPIIRRLFPDVPKNSACENAISLNITANILGLGNAATPMGIKAMKELSKSCKDKTASRSAVLFMTLNCASLQLIPASVAAIRTAAGSKNPFDIILPVWITSFLTLVVALLLASLFSFSRRREKLEN